MGPGGDPVAQSPVAEGRSLTKRYGGIEAVRAASIALYPGEVHALIGENGAGKSTLGKLFGGSVQPDEGEILVDGVAQHFRSPTDALNKRIATVQQEVTLVPQLSVTANVFLGIEASTWMAHRHGRDEERLDALEADVGIRVPRSKATGALSVAQRKEIEILRAVAREARVLILDEPTAVLSSDEIGKLHALVDRLRARGTSVLYVSHWLEEVLALADRITVMRNGEIVHTGPAAGQTAAGLARLMLGRDVDRAYPSRSTPAPGARCLLEVQEASRHRAFTDISLRVHAGEIVGLAGLVGSGRTEIARAIFGADRLDAGRVLLDGREIGFRSPADAVASGIAMITENRKETGLLLRRSVAENVVLAYLSDFVDRLGLMRTDAVREAVTSLIERLDVRPPNPWIEAGRLSGGNQQKTLFARWMARMPRVLIVDEPTAGVDVGAKGAIHELIVSLARSGMGVLLISSDLEEVLGLSTRVLVVRRGRIVEEFDGAESREVVAAAVLGTSVDE